MNRRQLVKSMLAGMFAGSATMTLAESANAAEAASVSPEQAELMRALYEDYVVISTTAEYSVGLPTVIEATFEPKSKWPNISGGMEQLLRHGKPVDFTVISTERVDPFMLGDPNYVPAASNTQVKVRLVGCEV